MQEAIKKQRLVNLLNDYRSSTIKRLQDIASSITSLEEEVKLRQEQCSEKFFLAQPFCYNIYAKEPEAEIERLNKEHEELSSKMQTIKRIDAMPEWQRDQNLDIIIQQIINVFA